jgi:hypothetical protein
VTAETTPRDDAVLLAAEVVIRSAGGAPVVLARLLASLDRDVFTETIEATGIEPW